MLTEPADLDRAELAGLLDRHWGLRGVQLEYLPVGFGSHHWRAVDSRGERRFVTVDDLSSGSHAGWDADSAFAALEGAFRTAAHLRDEAGLEFVLAPLLDSEGTVIRRVSERYGLTVSPFIEGKQSGWGPFESPGDRRRMGDILGRLHAATDQVPAGLPRPDDFAVPARAALIEAFGDLDRDWATGPFAEQVRRLLSVNAHDIERRLREYDELVARVRQEPARWVITHGETHRANVVVDQRGRFLLVDWDTTMIAPRERDLRMVLDDELIGWDEYVAAFGDASLHRQAIELYRQRWDLADISIYVDLFRRPHGRTEDTAASWKNLAGYLSR